MLSFFNVRNKSYTFLFIVFVFLYTNSMSEDVTSIKKNNIIQINDHCESALEWYNENPGLRGEFTRVLAYCKKYVKDVSPEGFQVNPILSDFGAINGVNTRPRDSIHQGIDIIGFAEEPILSIADGKVLETTVEDCWGSTIVIDHGEAYDGKNMITIYGHVGEFLVKENQTVKRGEVIAKLPSKVKYRCMARVRHLHLQIGQRYCQKEEKDNWGCKYFIKDFYRSLNPHNYWSNGANRVTCFSENKTFKKGTITYPFKCEKIIAKK